MKRLLLICLVLIPFALFTGCTKKKEAGDSKEPVAFVNGEPITEGDLYKLIGGYLKQIEKRIYQVKQGAVNHLVEQKLWEQAAKKAGQDKEAWLQGQTTPEDLKVTDKEIEEVWNAQKDRIKMKKEEFIPQLRSHLEMQKKNQAAQKVLAKLRSDAESTGNIKILLPEPEEELVNLAIAEAPVYGNPKAKVTLVEFTDYQCPYCAVSQDAIHKVLEHYKDKVKLAVMDFPLGQHTDAKPAAIAAYCVKEQNGDKFWEYRQKLFERTKNRQDLGKDALKEIAKNLQLDLNAFEQCVNAQKYLSQIEKSFAHVQEIGVGGTPAFFIIVGAGNTKGYRFSDAPTFEGLKQKIDKLMSKR